MTRCFNRPCKSTPRAGPPDSESARSAPGVGRIAPKVVGHVRHSRRRRGVTRRQSSGQLIQFPGRHPLGAAVEHANGDPAAGVLGRIAAPVAAMPPRKTFVREIPAVIETDRAGFIAFPLEDGGGLELAEFAGFIARGVIAADRAVPDVTGDVTSGARRTAHPPGRRDT